MRISLKEFAQAMSAVKSLSEGAKNAPGIMLEVDESKLNICYSDGKKSFIEKIDVLENEEHPIQGQIILNIKQIQSVVELSQPSGAIYTEDLELIAEEGNRMKIIGDKKVRLSGEDDSIEEKTASKMQYIINYYRPEESVRYGVISRMDYKGIFESDDFDIWGTQELKNILERTCGEKNRMVYISAITKTAFVANMAYTVNIPITSCEMHGFIVNTQMAKSLADILSKMESDTVSVWVKDKRYVNIISGDESIGLWFEMSPASKTDLVTLKRYENKGYNKYGLIVNKPVLQNVIGCALASDDNEKTKITFKETEGKELALRIVSSASSSSSMNDFCIIMESYTDNVGDILDVSIPVSLKVLADMLNKCVEDYVALDIDIDEGTKFIRVGDILDSEDGIELGTKGYTLASK